MSVYILTKFDASWPESATTIVGVFASKEAAERYIEKDKAQYDRRDADDVVYDITEYEVNE